MKKIALFAFVAVFTVQSAFAQPSFVPEDLSYDFRITRDDLGLKGNIKSVIYDVSSMNTAPANYIHLTIYGDFDNKIYEETQEPSNDYEKLRTPILAQLSSFTCSFANGSPNIENISWKAFHGLQSFNYHYTYDANNNVTSVITDGNYKKSFLLTYENGRLVKKDVECQEVEIVFPSTYKYDAQGRVIEVISVPTYKGEKNGDPSNRTYTYSTEDGKLKVVAICSDYKMISNDSKRNRNSFWVYDENGLLVESEMYVTKKNGKPFRASSGDKTVYTQIHSTYQYNSQGKLTTRNDDFYDKDGGMFSSGSHSCSRKTTFSYDSSGNLIRQQEKYYVSIPDLNISIEGLNTDLGTVLTTFKYEYDSNGNWISKETYVNGVLQSLMTREITYWD